MNKINSSSEMPNPFNRLPLGLAIASVALFAFGCGQHVPDHPLNPRSGDYVGDDAAKLDEDGNGIADVLDSMSSMAALSSSSVLVDPSSSSSAGDPLSSSSGVQPNSSSSEASVSSSSEVETPSSSSSGTIPTSSSSNVIPSSSSSIASGNIIVSVTGGIVTKTGTNFADFKPGAVVKVQAGATAIEHCFDHWSATGLALEDSTKTNLTFLAPPNTVNLTAISRACPDTLYDSRDGQYYGYEIVGDKVWMSQNLRYAPSDAPSFCYGKDDANCETYGRLYSWATAMGLDTSFNSKNAGNVENNKGVCPAGWHIPTKEEFAADGIELGLPQAGNGIPWDPANPSFETLGSIGFYWSSSVGKADIFGGQARDFCTTAGSATVCATAFVAQPANGSPDWRHYAQEDDKFLYFSVRCVMDE